MYDVRHENGGTVSVTEVGDHQPLYTLNADTLITYKLPDDDTLLIKRVGDFNSDADLLQAIGHRVHF